MRTLFNWLLVAGILAFSSSAMANKDEGFPGRKEFPKVPVLELKELKQMLDDVIVVDARSNLEFETLRVKDSINIPVASKSFENEIAKLRERTDKPIVFYCNGRRCFKSYIAVKKSQAVGINEVYAFDAGIFEWATAQPKSAVLLGKSPVKVKDLIAKAQFKAKLLDPDSFSTKIMDMGPSSMVLDVRDKFQRAGIGFYPGKERWCSLDDKEKLKKYLMKAKQSNKTLFIYDEVGKQVRWLQYEIEKMGLKNYYFMDKGAKAYYTSLYDWSKKK
ncbi:rhodanese-like domain-containing protein [Kaarinaea lacus]